MNRQLQNRTQPQVSPTIWMLVLLLVGVTVNPPAVSAFQSGQSSLEGGTEDKFVMVVKLTDQQIQQMKVAGAIQTRVPRPLVGKVAAIKLVHASPFLRESISIEPTTTRRQTVLETTVDESVIDRLAYQPVEFKVYDSGFNTLLIRYIPVVAMLNEPKNGLNIGFDDSPLMMIRLSGDRSILGYLDGLKTISVNGEVGKVSLATDKIAGMKFHIGDKDQAFVVLNSGDELTVNVDLEKVTILSRWGKTEVPVEDLDSITATINQKFIPVNNSSRWRLIFAPTTPGMMAIPASPNQFQIPNNRQ